MVDAPDFMDGGSSITKAFIMAMVGSQAATPTIDAVHVVRCKDCKRRGTYDCPIYVGGDGMHSEPDDWFCADGERRG